ncbi:MAG: MerR family transcriptional regulator [Aestuariivirga sp.]
MKALAIGKLAASTGTKVQTIRYYEEIGLIRPFMRSDGGHRLYGPEDVNRLKFIRHARELGFAINAIRELLKLSDNPETSCAAVDAIARAQLEQVDIRIEKLTALRNELGRMIGECSHGRISHCRVIEVLSDHRHCTTEH